MEIKHRRGKDNIIPDALSRAVETIEVGEVTDDWYTGLYKRVEEAPDLNLDYKIENGKLYKFVSSKTEVFDYRYEWKLCVPENFRKEILQTEHDNAFHIGYEKLLEKVRQRYFWPNMTTVIRKYVQNCQACKEFKPSNVSQHPETGKPRLTTKPFQILSIDFIQSLPRSKSGHMHLLVLLDLFSKYTMLIPVRKISTAIVIKALEEQWFRRYSTPEILISDNATCFLSKDFKTFLNKYIVHHCTNARHHSQSNPVERLNRSINAWIRTYVKSDQRLWD